MQKKFFIVESHSNSQSNIQNHVIVYLSDCFQISDSAKEKAKFKYKSHSLAWFIGRERGRNIPFISLIQKCI